MKIDRNRFGFIRETGSPFGKTLHRANMILRDISNSKPYIIDWDEVLKDYDQKGVGDVCEFACSYTFGWHAKNGKLEDDASKHAMYLEIIDGIAIRRENVI